MGRDAPRPRRRPAAPRDDVFVFLGDRFVSQVVVPRQKILQARRQLALAELQTPGFAALLHGLIAGKSPASIEVLLEAGLLRKDELAHAAGGAIAWELAKDGLYLATQERVIRRLVDEALDGRGPRGAAASAPGPMQLIFEGASAPGAPLLTALGWLLEGELLENAGPARDIAAVLLQGAPEVAARPGGYEALAKAYLGHVPVTPAGKLYEPAPEGPRDPDRGTPHAPIWPALPVKGSPAAALLSLLSRFRTELSFDDEPGGKGADRPQSLHARVSLGGDRPAEAVTARSP
jgi:hypothetical protein